MRESSPSDFLDRAVGAAASALAAAGVLCVVALMAVVTYEVVSRYLLNAPTAWADEIASYLLIEIVFLGLAQNLRRGDHIRIEIVTARASDSARRWLDLIAYAVGLAFSVMLLTGTWIRFENFWSRNTVSDSPLMTPLWIPMTPVIIGAAVFVLAMATGLIATSRALRNEAGARGRDEHSVNGR